MVGAVSLGRLSLQSQPVRMRASYGIISPGWPPAMTSSSTNAVGDSSVAAPAHREHSRSAALWDAEARKGLVLPPGRGGLASLSPPALMPAVERLRSSRRRGSCPGWEPHRAYHAAR